MNERRSNIIPYVDWLTITLYITLVIIGWLNIYSAVYNPAHPSLFDNSQRYGKEFIWIVTAFLIAFLVMLSDASVFSVFAFIFYGAVFVLLLAAAVIGKDVKGSHSWIKFGSMEMQPAELGIFAINLGLAKYLSGETGKMQKAEVRLMATALLAIPMLVIIFLEKETGVAITYAAFIFVLYREGLSGNFLLIGLLVAVLFILALVSSKMMLTGILIGIAVVAFVIFTKRKTKDVLRVGGVLALALGILWGTSYAYKHLPEHQKKRIEVFLHQNVNKNKEGYNLNQAEIAIGSGSFWGKGFLQGTQTKFHFVPEQATDFIFCTLCEEWGFMGASFVILLFLALMVRVIFLAERQRSPFSRIYGYGVASVLFIHFTVNIGMTLGLIPVIGIPLPFISYGGSSLWAFTLLLFIFLRLDANRMQILK